MALNVQAAVKAQILGNNLIGMVGKTEKDNHKVTEFLVMPSVEENEPITVQKVVEEINNTIYRIKHNTAEVPNPFPVEDVVITDNAVNTALSVLGIPDASLTFMQTFVHYKRSVEMEGLQEKAGTEEKILEYAIGIHIKARAINPSDFKFLQIEDIYLNVWDTQNGKVLERMQIWTPELLEQK